MKSRSIYDDSRFINPDTLTQYAKTNEAYLRGPVKGLVIEFPGLDGGSCLGGNLTMGNYDSVYAQDFGANGILLAYLYTGPWSWSSSSVRYADAVIAAITAKYALLEETPLVVCGGSMGGYGALLYALEGRHNLCAVAIACPCTDIAFVCDHSIHPEMARTVISAIMKYDMPLDEAMCMLSPTNHICALPDVPYFICSDGADDVFPEEQIETFTQKLQSQGLTVTYFPQPDKKHGYFIPEVRRSMHSFIKFHILKKE